MSSLQRPCAIDGGNYCLPLGMISSAIKLPELGESEWSSIGDDVVTVWDYKREKMDVSPALNAITCAPRPGEIESFKKSKSIFAWMNLALS